MYNKWEDEDYCDFYIKEQKEEAILEEAEAKKESCKESL